MSTTLTAWQAATKDLRKDIYSGAYAKAEASIRKGREGKVKGESVWTHHQQKEAANLANAAVVNELYAMTEHGGVQNPAVTDEVWGHAAQTPEAPKTVKPNRYAANCNQCGGRVEAEQGALVKTPDGKWGADHLDGQCPASGSPDKAPAALAVGLDISALRPGYYAVPDGDTRLKLAISQGGKGGKWEGYTFVKDGAEYGQGQRYGMQRPGQTYSGDVQEQLAAILADPKGAMAAYGKLVGRCGACGRKLEDANSIAKGIGPVCEAGW